MPTPPAFRARAYAGERDLPAIVDLLSLCSAEDQNEDTYSIAEVQNDFTHPDLDLARDVRLWDDPAGRLAGFGQISIAREGAPLDGFAYIRVHPAARPYDLGDAVVAWAAGRLREVGQARRLPVRLHSWAREQETYTHALLQQHGFAPVRYFLKMARPLDQPIPDPLFPPGFTLRHVAGDEDVARWVDAYNQSFIDHWNHHPETVEAHRHYLARPGYRPEQDLVALAPDGTFAAFCFCQVNAEENAREGRNEGWIDMLGTRRGFRGLGLGRAMLLAGLQRLRTDGVDTAVLGVDAENPTGALRLYESVGFARVHASVSYAKELDGASSE